MGKWAIHILDNFKDNEKTLPTILTTGFKVNSGEYKLMGFNASYGKPIYRSKILENLVDIKDDGSFRLNQSFFNYATGLTMTNKFEKLFG